MQDESERHDIDITEAGPSGTFMDNKKRCNNHKNYVSDESDNEESEDEQFDINEQLRRKEVGAEDAQENNEVLVENSEEGYNTQPKRKWKPETEN